MSWTNSDGIGKIEVLEVFGNDLTVVNSLLASIKLSSLLRSKDAAICAI